MLYRRLRTELKHIGWKFETNLFIYMYQVDRYELQKFSNSVKTYFLQPQQLAAGCPSLTCYCRVPVAMS